MKYMRAKAACLALVGGVCVTGSAFADASFNFSKSSSKSVGGGDNNFDAGYTLGFSASGSKSGSTARAGADAQGSTWVKLFGKRFDAVSVRGQATTSVGTSSTPCSAKLTYETYLVGVKVPTASGSMDGGKYTSKDLIRRSQRLSPKVEVNIVRIGPAVLGLEAYAQATEYINLNGTVWCGSVSATLRPGANISAVANFRADAAIVAAGIRGSLTMADLSLPLTASVGWSYKSQPLFIGSGVCTWTMSASASAKLELIPVSGKFEPWVRVGLPCTDVFGLLPGKGICLNKEWSHTIWNKSVSKQSLTIGSTSGAPFLGDNTAQCPTNTPGVPTRS